MGVIFFEITVIVCLAAVLAIILRFLKQSSILAYIIAGTLIGSVSFLNIQGEEALKSLAEIGVTLLLFLLALELRLSGLRSVGVVVLTLGILQIIITVTLSFALGMALGFTSLYAFYLAIILTFSSTIIIVKLLSDKKDLGSLSGKITIGILLLQDFFAIFILIILSAIGNQAISLFSISDLVIVILKAVLLLGGVILASIVLPYFVNAISRSEESLFLFSLAWVFGFAGIVSSPVIGFPIEIGGFAAGIALSTSYEHYQIAARLKALRDFFITIFFVMLGTQMKIGDIGQIILPVVFLVLFVVFVKPFIVFVIMTTSGYSKRSAFLTGINFGQISEFSLIILFLGIRFGHISPSFASLITIVSVASFVISPYLISYGNVLYRKISPQLSIFETRHLRKEQIYGEEFSDLEDHVALIGANRTGKSILEALKEEGEKVLVIDFDPDIVSELKKNGTVSLFGDISDLDIHEKAKLHRAKMVISTVSDREDNLHLVRSLNKDNKKAKIIVLATEIEDAKELYANGVDYVLLPHMVGGRHLASLIRDNKLAELDKIKKKDLAILNASN